MLKIILCVLGVIVFIGGIYFLLRGSAPSPQPQEQDSAQATSSDQAQSQPSNTTQTTANIMSATLHTNRGDITVAFYPDQAPGTVANFIKLAQSGFYDATKFHRVIKGFMDQGGDPLTKDDSQQARWGTGGPGYTIPDEFGTTYTNVAGTIAMANTGQPNSAGSQFFINAVDNHFLDGKYTVFGHVTKGMDVVTAINNVPTDSSDRPTTPVVLESITLQ